MAALRSPQVALACPGHGSPSCPPASQQTTATVAAGWPRRIERRDPRPDPRRRSTYLPLNPGEAWGYLRIFPRGPRRPARPTDIPVFDELPLDLSVVAGVLTRAFQDTNSHVNLKSKERGTPNMVLRDAGPDHPRLAPFADQPVHLVVARRRLHARADDRPRRSSRRSSPSGWTGRGPARLGAGDRAPLVRRDGRRPRRADPARSPRASAPRPPTSASWPTATCSAGSADPGSPSASAGYDLVPQGFGSAVQSTRTSSTTRRTRAATSSRR